MIARRARADKDAARSWSDGVGPPVGLALAAARGIPRGNAEIRAGTEPLVVLVSRAAVAGWQAPARRGR
jgi:hypothetical protein